MREIVSLKQWVFSKDNQTITLPHTWNNIDGQDGGDDYYRGEYTYKCTLPSIAKGKCAYCEFEGANHIAKVYVNGKLVGSHEGGFATFRVDVTKALLQGEAELIVSVDNNKSHVYPQMADFTFYGGLYRAANLVIVEQAHFALSKSGTKGVFITPTPMGDDAKVRVDVFCENAKDCKVKVLLQNHEGETKAEACIAVNEDTASEVITLRDAIRWNGVENPYLYNACVQLILGEETLDELIIPFGVREYYVDAEKGFFLNGKSYPLHGVARHQDRQDKGWALSDADQQEDIALICEIGANTIRLAHYQHSQVFYDLCDKAGLVIWAEIPFISCFMPSQAAIDNTHSQMTELVAQNYNHASICFWGIANEITIGGDDSKELVDNLRSLATLTKRLDPSRLTTMAQVAMLKMDSEHNKITDVLSYNHYFGWYMGDVSQNGPWLDAFHAQYKDRPLGVSEYGAEAILSWHSAKPVVRDYSEEYQAYYHEEMLKTFATRAYLWSTHVWNMFDFAADARDEGGSIGRNNKGLVTYDRKIKKDSFYIYKAYWTSVPFVHICSKRFEQRSPEQCDIKVYSNCESVTLSINGEERILQGDKVFLWENAPLIQGENKVTATANDAQPDTAVFIGVPQANLSYCLPEDEDAAKIAGVVGVENWFDTIVAQSTEMTFPQGYYSIHDTIGELIGNPITAQILMNAVTSMMGKEMMSGGMAKMMIKMMGKKPLEEILAMGGDRVPKNAKQLLNEQLIKVKK